MTLATGTNSCFLGRQYKKHRRQWTLTCSGLQIAKQLDSREDIVRVIHVNQCPTLSPLPYCYLFAAARSDLPQLNLQHCSMQGLLFDENSYWVQQWLSEVSPLVPTYSRKIWRGIKFGGLVV